MHSGIFIIQNLKSGIDRLIPKASSEAVQNYIVEQAGGNQGVS